MTTVDFALGVPPRRHISPVRAVRHGLTLAGRSIVRIRKSPEVLLDVTVQPILFLVLFVFLFGGAIAGNWHVYLETLVPGIMAQNTLFASLGTGASLSTDIEKGVFDRFRSLPIARSAPLVGAVLGDTVRFLTATVVLLLTAFALGFRLHHGFVPLLLVVVIMLAAGFALTWMGVFVAMLVGSPQAAQGLMVAVLFPLSFGSNVFVPAGTLPGPLRWIATYSPVSQLVNVTRGLLLGGPVAGPLLATTAWLVGIVAVFFPLALRFYHRKVA